MRKTNPYENVNVSPRALSIAIIVMLFILAAILVLCALNGGRTVSFEANGGSTVVSVRVKHGGSVVSLDDKVRDGCTFTVWLSSEDVKTAYMGTSPYTPRGKGMDTLN